MLSQFSFSNYKSFKKEAFLDFTAESIKDHEKSVIKDKVDGERFLPVIAIYGPNGGGKSTVLEALRYLSILLMRPFIMSQIQNNTEFESICYEKELHAESFETRYVLVDDLEDKEKVKAIHISASRAELAKRAELLNKYKLSCISPIALDISNLLEINKSENLENMAIVNIEGTTTVTSIIQQKIYEINTIDAGITDILARNFTVFPSIIISFFIVFQSSFLGMNFLTNLARSSLSNSPSSSSNFFSSQSRIKAGRLSVEKKLVFFKSL